MKPATDQVAVATATIRRELGPDAPVESRLFEALVRLLLAATPDELRSIAHGATERLRRDDLAACNNSDGRESREAIAKHRRWLP